MQHWFWIMVLVFSTFSTTAQKTLADLTEQENWSFRTAALTETGDWYLIGTQMDGMDLQLYRSLDEMKSLEAVGEIPVPVENAHQYQLVALPKGLYLVIQPLGQLWVSSDKGKNWLLIEDIELLAGRVDILQVENTIYLRSGTTLYASASGLEFDLRWGPEEKDLQYCFVEGNRLYGVNSENKMAPIQDQDWLPNRGFDVQPQDFKWRASLPARLHSSHPRYPGKFASGLNYSCLDGLGTLDAPQRAGESSLVSTAIHDEHYYIAIRENLDDIIPQYAILRIPLDTAPENFAKGEWEESLVTIPEVDAQVIAQFHRSKEDLFFQLSDKRILSLEKGQWQRRNPKIIITP